MFLFERNTAFVLQGSPSGRLPRFARNDRVLRTEYNKSLFTRIYLQNFRSFFILSRATHFMSLRAKIRGPRGILCTRGEKEYASIRQPTVACDDCLVKNEAYDAEEKAHTSKRVSVIACDNVISKVQLSGTPRDTVYSRGKGAHKQKSEHYCLQ